MKTVKLIAGILGLLGAFVSLYVMFISPGYVSAAYPLFATIFLVLGSILLLATKKKATLGIAAGSFFLSLIMFFSHVANISSEEAASGVSVLPDYIPDSIEMIGTAVILIAFIMAAVSIFGKYDEAKVLTQS